MRTPRTFFVVLTWLVASAATAWAQETGFLNRSIAIEGAEYRYQVYVPREFKSSTSLPIILALHGGGQYGRDGLLQTDVGLAHAIRLHPERFPPSSSFRKVHLAALQGFRRSGNASRLARWTNQPRSSLPTGHAPT